MDLQRAMMNLPGMTTQSRTPPVSLNDVVNADAIEATGILDDSSVQEALVPLLAEGQQNVGELREIIRSPQLQQALQALTGALQSSNFNNIMSSFELDPANPRSAEAMARGDAVEALLQALIHAAKAKREREAAAEGAATHEGEGDGKENMDSTEE